MGRPPDRRTARPVRRRPAPRPPPEDAAYGRGCAVDRWAAEAELLLRADGGRPDGRVTVRLATGQRLLLDLAPDRDGSRSGASALRISAAPEDGAAAALPVLPDAATWVPPDLELLRAGLIDSRGCIRWSSRRWPRTVR